MNAMPGGVTVSTAAVLTAVASAALFGLSTSLQHRVAAQARAEPTTSGFFVRLARDRRWRIGIGLSVVAFCLHAAAIGLGGLVLVQPIIVTGIVFAVLARARFAGHWPTRGEVGWACVVWAGLAAFIAATGGDPAYTRPTNASIAAAVGAGVAVAGLAVAAGKRVHSPRIRGLWFGIAAGLLFALVAVLLRLVYAQAETALWSVPAHWTVWAMVAVGLWAMSLNQRAYQATRLSVSMPVLNVVDVLATLGLAVALFDEHLTASPLAATVDLAALTAMATGVGRLMRIEERLEPATDNHDSAPSTAVLPADEYV